MGSGTRVRRTIAEKRRIVELSLEPGASVARIAPAEGVNANQIFQWRRAYRLLSHNFREGIPVSPSGVIVKISTGIATCCRQAILICATSRASETWNKTGYAFSNSARLIGMLNQPAAWPVPALVRLHWSNRLRRDAGQGAALAELYRPGKRRGVRRLHSV